MKFSELAQGCYRYLHMRGYAATTLDTYDTRWQQFRAYLKHAELDDDLRSFTGAACFEYCGYLHDRGASPNTILGQLAALSTLARYGMKAPDGRGKPILLTDPTRTFDWPTPTRPETKYLLPEELRAFLQRDVPTNQGIARDLAMETGLRASELCRANVGDVRHTNERYYVAVTVKGRGSRERKLDVPLSLGLARRIQAWVLERDGKPMDPLLIDGAGKRFKRTGLTSLFDRIGKQAGITRMRVSAHKLRHTANVVARQSGLDATVRSKLLNHTSPQSLERYEHLMPGELHEARERQLDAMQRYICHDTDSPRTD